MFRALSHSFSLLLPALIPSWRFFKAVQPSPRVEWAVSLSSSTSIETWQEFRPRPTHLSALQMAQRMFWNAEWNENLYLVSLSERLMGTGSEHSLTELTTLVRCDVLERAPPFPSDAYLQFRLVFVDRDGDDLHRHITYQSDLIKLHPHEL